MSSLNLNSLMKAVGVSFEIYVVFYGCSWAVNSAISGSLTEMVQLDDSTFLALAAPGLLLGCIGFLMYLAYGALYGFFARRDGEPVDVGMYALGGALTGVIIAIV